MARLTNAELAHMKSRVAAIRDDALATLNQKHTRKATAASDKAKLYAILDGEVEPIIRRYQVTDGKATKELNRPLREVFDFTDLECAESIDDSKEYREAKAAIVKAYREALDVIILKDREQANEAFARFKAEYED